MTEPKGLAKYVGFSEADVMELCKKYHMNFDEAKRWYDGYERKIIEGKVLFIITQKLPIHTPQFLQELALHIRNQLGFIFIIDEWDCIFREAPEDKQAQKAYLDFLRDLFKDRTYVKLAYMTGILPVKKYGTHSALNIFDEFSMTSMDMIASLRPSKFISMYTRSAS